jgi:hypothetical protein
MVTRGGRWPVVLLALAGAAVLLLAAGRVWAQGQVDGLAGPVPVSVTGRQASPVLPALGLIAGAAGLVLAICGPVLRWVAAAGLVATGAAACAAVLVGDSDAGRLLEPAAARAAGVTGATPFRPAVGLALERAAGRGAAAAGRRLGVAEPDRLGCGRPALSACGGSARPGTAEPGPGRGLGRAQPGRRPDRSGTGRLTCPGRDG